MSATFKEYLDHIRVAATTIFEGMAVTMSYLFRRPVTIQYPDRVPRPIHETLPPRYRGFLEVDTDICTACLACERACPIECIKIDAEKDKETRRLVMTRFDIDIAKCMFCGLCSEPCPTGAIVHTPHFEASTAYVENLVFRFVPEGTAIEAFKPFKGYDAPRARHGQILESMGLVHTAARDRAFRPPPADLPRIMPPTREASTAPDSSESGPAPAVTAPAVTAPAVTAPAVTAPAVAAPTTAAPAAKAPEATQGAQPAGTDATTRDAQAPTAHEEPGVSDS